MAAATSRWTADMVRALPADGNRYEVIDGELFVTPGPSWEHQRAIGTLFLRVRPYVVAHAIGEAMFAPADVEFTASRMVEPDLFVIPLVNGHVPGSWQEAGRLILAVEVISPSTALVDRQIKRRLYQSQGVPEYWIIDVAARLIERWRSKDDRPEILTDHLKWQPDANREPLDLDVVSYFEEFCGK